MLQLKLVLVAELELVPMLVTQLVPILVTQMVPKPVATSMIGQIVFAGSATVT